MVSLMFVLVRVLFFFIRPKIKNWVHFTLFGYLFFSFLFLFEMCFMFCATTLEAGSVKERYGGNKVTLLRETWAFAHVFYFVFGLVISMQFGFCLGLCVYLDGITLYHSLGISVAHHAWSS